MQIVSLTSEQRMLREVVREMLDADSGPDAVRRSGGTEHGFDEALWRKAADLGWFGLEVPEESGGAGGTYLETSIVLREIGRCATPGPYLPHSLAVAAMAAAPDSAPAGRWLDTMLSGEAIGAVVLPTVIADGRTRYPVRAVESGPDAVLHLTGCVADVPDLGVADVVVVAADGPDGPCVFAVPAEEASLQPEWNPTHDRTRRLYRLDLDRCAVAEQWRLAAGEEAARLVDSLMWRAATGIALDGVGGAGRVVEMAVEHAKEREQFGRPIGAFQAVKHMCADAFLEAETARVAADAAVMEIAGTGPRRAYWSSVARFRAADAYARAAGAALQIHGGIGMTWEFDLHLWLKRAKLNRAIFGSCDAHRARVARIASGAHELVAAGEGDRRWTSR
ncbi:acyl-CoA dehydrogenase family protein [Actinomadura livida]|uniref:Acyl-CoA dehydrogenase family protein n=1 Tax=Actinomadura livida TaxID=79909 RepID=A0A7W7MYE2_9ACTN|nr:MULTISPECIES: acyl-CoA dehydrogenase family protein [Actinomadura]MBB4774725.1 alkylation response protein AidB-like acyl-CoA dehydrogenase [Actinomadura catellatispora]GGU06402.1 acyl-CoA dehydrogenase [Actinomadura livida]